MLECLHSCATISSYTFLSMLAATYLLPEPQSYQRSVSSISLLQIFATHMPFSFLAFLRDPCKICKTRCSFASRMQGFLQVFKVWHNSDISGSAPSIFIGRTAQKSSNFLYGCSDRVCVNGKKALQIFVFDLKYAARTRRCECECECDRVDFSNGIH